MILADYKGLTVEQLRKLREEIKKVGGNLFVVKNTLLKKAMEQLKLTKENFDFTGPTAVILADEEMGALKAIAGFAKSTNLPSLKWGLLNQLFTDKNALTRLSTLPTREQLMAQLTGLLASPLPRLVYSLKFNPQKLIITLKNRETHPSPS